MKQRISIFTIAILLVAVATPAFAQGVRINLTGDATSTPVKVRAEAKAEMEARKASSTERMAERKAEVQVRQASSTAKRVEMQRGIAKRKAEHTARVLTATVERLEKIITRLESRIAKVKANGGVTTESEGFVAEARTHLSLAKTSIALFASVDLSGDKASENFERVRNIAAEVKEHLREAHRSLVQAVVSLGKTRAEVNVTSTVEVE